MSPSPCSRSAALGRFPRVSGDEPTPEMTPMAYVMFSPRERG